MVCKLAHEIDYLAQGEYCTDCTCNVFCICELSILSFHKKPAGQHQYQQSNRKMKKVFDFLRNVTPSPSENERNQQAIGHLHAGVSVSGVARAFKF